MNPILFVGTYTQSEGHVDGKAQGIYTYQMNSDGQLDSLSVFPNIVNPSYLAIHPNGKFLYAVSETVFGKRSTEPMVVSLKINADYSLTEINRISAEGSAPCYISIHSNGRYALIANYGSGNVVVFNLDPDGRLIKPIFNYQSVGPKANSNQKSAHAHYINCHRNGIIYSTDLGSDCIFSFDLKDSLKLIGQSFLPPGSGPRHLAFHPSLPKLYCLNELAGTIQVLDMLEYGQLSSTQLISSIDPRMQGNASSADLVITPNGNYLYASNRGDHNSIGAFKVNPTNGNIDLIQHYTSWGDAPRAIALSPDGNKLLVANQNTDNILVYHIDTSKGELTHRGVDNRVPTPVCMKFLTLSE